MRPSAPGCASTAIASRRRSPSWIPSSGGRWRCSTTRWRPTTGGGERCGSGLRGAVPRLHRSAVGAQGRLAAGLAGAGVRPRAPAGGGGRAGRRRVGRAGSRDMSVGLARLRDEPDVVRRGAEAKGEDPSVVDAALEIDERRRALLAEGDALKAERNSASRRVGEAIRGGTDPEGPEVAELKEASARVGERIAEIDRRLAEVDAALDEAMLRIPNPADPDVPIGGEEANAVVRTWGECLPRIADAWERMPHWELGERLGIIDNPRGAKVSGSGFPVYVGAGAALQRALINWFMDVHATEHAMTEIWPPAVVNADSARGTGQIPDKEDQMYVVERDGLYLVPTAEVPVTNLHRDEILDASELPIRYAAYSPCFRREAGAAGQGTPGILPVHPVDKVEVVLFE